MEKKIVCKNYILRSQESSQLGISSISDTPSYSFPKPCLNSHSVPLIVKQLEHLFFGHKCENVLFSQFRVSQRVHSILPNFQGLPRYVDGISDNLHVRLF